MIVTYFEWLANQVQHTPEDRSLLRRLYYKPFIYDPPKKYSGLTYAIDSDRIFDANALKAESKCTDCPEYVSLLEIVIALSRRCFYQYEDITPEAWARKLIENVGFFDHVAFNSMAERLVNRWYQRNGEGSFFPLKNPPEQYDSRQKSMWYQMHAYISEMIDEDARVQGVL